MRERTDAGGNSAHRAIWVLAGCAIGWLGYIVFHDHEQHGVLATVTIGVVGTSPPADWQRAADRSHRTARVRPPA